MYYPGNTHCVTTYYPLILCFNSNSLKIIKGILLDIQGSVDIEEWLPENNPLLCVAGVLKSARITKTNETD